MGLSKEELLQFEPNVWLRLRNRLLHLILSPYRLIKTLFMITGMVFWLALSTLLITWFSILESLPHFNENGFEQAKRTATARIEQKTTISHTNLYQWTELKNIHRELLYAIVMSEDGDFFNHSGIDYDALINAIGENIKRREWSFGASTISQQTVKNIYLSEAKTLYRKAKELITTQRLENALSKNQILELYLNIIEFGPDIYGIHHAAHYYFQTTPDKLNAAQGAFLALLMPSPRKYHFTIYQNKYLAKPHMKKYKRILQDMRFKEYISPRQYQLYLHWPFFKK